jgi:predicted Zn-dependent peptidase
MFMALESPLARAEGLAGQVLLFDRPLSPAEMAAGIDEVTTADIRAYGERLLSQRRCAAAVLGPKRALGAAEAFERALFATA